MGLEASVMCTCYAEGKTTPSPFPDRLVIDSAGFPALLARPDADDEKDSEQFAAWLRSCCAHPGMLYEVAYVASWHGYREFLTALESLGWDHFPALEAGLPISNAGTMPAQAAANALAELDYFNVQGNVSRNLFVINGETRERLFSYVPEHHGVFIWDGDNGHNIGLERDGFFIEDAWEMSRIVFRAPRMEQLLLEPDATEANGSGRVQYTDPDSGRRFECKTPIPGREIPWDDGRMRNDEGRFRLEYPRLLEVEEQPLTADYFAYIVEPLTKLFKAAVDTGNPVRWS